MEADEVMTMNNKKGFTLIELIVAISLVTMVSVFIAGFITPLFKSYSTQERYNFVSNQINSALIDMTSKLQFADKVTVGASGGATSGLDRKIYSSSDAIYYEGGEKFGKTYFSGCKSAVTFERIDNQTIEVTITAYDTGLSVTSSATVKIEGTGSAGIGTEGGSALSGKIAYHVPERKDLINHPE